MEGPNFMERKRVIGREGLLRRRSCGKSLTGIIVDENDVVFMEVLGWKSPIGDLGFKSFERWKCWSL